jgi:hypothetical protein
VGPRLLATPLHGAKRRRLWLLLRVINPLRRLRAYRPNSPHHQRWQRALGLWARSWGERPRQREVLERFGLDPAVVDSLVTANHRPRRPLGCSGRGRYVPPASGSPKRGGAAANPRRNLSGGPSQASAERWAADRAAELATAVLGRRLGLLEATGHLSPSEAETLDRNLRPELEKVLDSSLRNYAVGRLGADPTLHGPVDFRRFFGAPPERCFAFRFGPEPDRIHWRFRPSGWWEGVAPTGSSGGTLIATASPNFGNYPKPLNLGRYPGNSPKGDGGSAQDRILSRWGERADALVASALDHHLDSLVADGALATAARAQLHFDFRERLSYALRDGLVGYLSLEMDRTEQELGLEFRSEAQFEGFLGDSLERCCAFAFGPDPNRIRWRFRPDGWWEGPSPMESAGGYVTSEGAPLPPPTPSAATAYGDGTLPGPWDPWWPALDHWRSNLERWADGEAAALARTSVEYHTPALVGPESQAFPELSPPAEVLRERLQSFLRQQLASFLRSQLWHWPTMASGLDPATDTLRTPENFGDFFGAPLEECFVFRLGNVPYSLW